MWSNRSKKYVLTYSTRVHILKLLLYATASDHDDKNNGARVWQLFAAQGSGLSPAGVTEQIKTALGVAAVVRGVERATEPTRAQGGGTD